LGGALLCLAIANTPFEHLEKMVDVLEYPAAKHLGEVVVQHLGMIAKLVRYLARCARGIQRVGEDASTSREIHGLLAGVRFEHGPSRKQAPHSDSLSGVPAK